MAIFLRNTAAELQQRARREEETGMGGGGVVLCSDPSSRWCVGALGLERRPETEAEHGTGAKVWSHRDLQQS